MCDTLFEFSPLLEYTTMLLCASAPVALLLLAVVAAMTDAAGSPAASSSEFRHTAGKTCMLDKQQTKCEHIKLRVGDLCVVADQTQHGAATVPARLGSCDGAAGGSESPVWVTYDFFQLQGYNSTPTQWGSNRGCLNGGGSDTHVPIPGAQVTMDFCSAAMDAHNIRFPWPPPNRTQLSFTPFPATSCATAGSNRELVVARSCDPKDAVAFDVILVNV